MKRSDFGSSYTTRLFIIVTLSSRSAHQPASAKPASPEPGVPIARRTCVADDPRILSPEELKQLLDHIDTLIRENQKLRETLDAAMKQRPYFPDRRKEPRGYVAR